MTPTTLLHIAPVVDGVREEQWFAVLDDGGFAVGRVSMRQMDGPLRRCACIKQLFVDPGFRRRGIGRQLLEACIDNAVAEACDVITLAVSDLSAIPFYVANRFQVVAEFPEEIWMSRFIDPAPATFEEDRFTEAQRVAIFGAIPVGKDWDISIESTPSGDVQSVTAKRDDPNHEF